MWALAQAHGNVAAKPPRALLPWSTCCSSKYIVLCPTMQALEKRRGGKGAVTGVWADAVLSRVARDRKKGKC